MLLFYAVLFSRKFIVCRISLIVHVKICIDCFSGHDIDNRGKLSKTGRLMINKSIKYTTKRLIYYPIHYVMLRVRQIRIRYKKKNLCLGITCVPITYGFHLEHVHMEKKKTYDTYVHMTSMSVKHLYLKRDFTGTSNLSVLISLLLLFFCLCLSL